MARLAGAGCVVLPLAERSPCYRIWIDPTMAVYLWETLVEICGELGGAVVGAAAVFGEQLVDAPNSV
jgi:hypothetical protein